jgi:oxygen-independent coproporphyrinogen-3 oxidase
MYSLVKDRLQEAHYLQYEVSNFAKPEWSCKHNLAYWSGTDYLGVGAGAHSYLRSNEVESPAAAVYGARWSNVPGPIDYLSRPESSTIQLQEKVSKEQAIREFFMLRMRRNCGVTRDEFREALGDEFPGALKVPIEQLVQRGFLTDDGERIALTDSGFLLSNSVFARLTTPEV